MNMLNILRAKVSPVKGLSFNKSGNFASCSQSGNPYYASTLLRGVKSASTFMLNISLKSNVFNPGWGGQIQNVKHQFH